MRFNERFLKLIVLVLICASSQQLSFAQELRLQRPSDMPAIDPATGRPALTGGVRETIINTEAQPTNLQGGVQQPLFNGAALNAETQQSQFNMGATTNVGGVTGAPINMGAGRYAPTFNSGVSTLNGGVNTAPLQGSATNRSLQGGANYAPLQGSAPSVPLQSGVNQQAAALNARTSAGLTQTQIDRLASHDLVLIIDQSGSMSRRDCMPLSVGGTGGALLNTFFRSASATQAMKIKRWEWCGAQTARLAQITGPLAAKGFTVILFSQHYKVFNNVTLNQVPSIFTNERPETNTRLADPLRSAISDYFTRRQNTGGKVKPLGIAILSDGDPNDGSAVIDAIAEATQHMQRGEIKITFLMVGASDERGRTFITQMYDELPRRGARFPFVRTVPFFDLEKYGLARALADALQ